VRRGLALILLSAVFGAGVAFAAVREPDAPPLPGPPPALPGETALPPAPPPTPAVGPPAGLPEYPAAPSRALGRPTRGRLVRGVQLPEAGPDHLTWDPVLKQSPSRPWRRWGTDRLVRVVLRVLREYREAHPDAPPVLVGDLSRPEGGDFSARFGGLGHASHQNGLDVDVYYPRRDRLPRAPRRPAQVDRRLASALVHRFAEASARYVFVGPSLGLPRPRRIVQPLVHHDDHLHFRLQAGALKRR
jgi:murein endopeptidase